jgi:branched-chain amino acid transport system substrate-binding protein
MAILARGLAVAAALSAGCAQTLGFNDCNTNDDCAAMQTDAGKLFCTSDHLCVLGLPDEQLCPEVLGTPGGNSLVIAVLSDKSSMNGMPLAADHQIENAVRLAVAEINMRQAGGNQPPIVAYLCDTASDAGQALKAAKRAVNVYGAQAIVGPMNSSEVVNINSFIRDAGVLVISPSATAIDITQLQDNGLVWRTAPSDARQSKTLAQNIQKDVLAAMGKPIVDTMHDPSVYGSGLDAAFAKEYATLMAPDYHQSFLFSTPADIPNTLNSLNADQPTHLLIISDVMTDPQIVGMIAQQSFLAMNTQFYLTDSADTDALFGGGGMTVDPSILAKIHLTVPATPTGLTFSTFQSTFRGMFTVDPATTAFVANAYDATYLIAIAAAATQGHVPTGKDLAQGMMRLKTTGTPVPVGPTNYLAALMQMSQGGVRLDGASGPLEYDAAGDLLNGAYDYLCVNTMGNMPTFVPCP